ncbi:unnamed protein product [Bursaphelenchus okinawaensis]|uniref:Uncharacterized protein n=1 Tax=Bursaphelenchus okinawaensis TaxID=465554 RepID=A0A811KDY7_9BILA|nr:unnamed protein product [Bursaphelenchus okinawaensis]CAG9101389.1 unnamed protein product [Bursaphelenchus okinawaensis]
MITILHYTKNPNGPTCLVKRYGGYLAACSRTAVVDNTKEFYYYCASYYNIYDSDSRVLDIPFAEVLWAAPNNTVGPYTCGLQVVSEEDEHENNIEKHVMLFGCFCDPSGDMNCDTGLPDPRPKDEGFMRPNRTCYTGDTDNATIVSGFVGFCTYEEGEYNITDRAVDNDICFELNSKLLKLKGRCQCCCINEVPLCNSLFVPGKQLYDTYRTCEEEAKHGEYDVFFINKMAFHGALPYSSNVFFPPPDVMDINREFEKIMAFFELDVVTFKVEQMGSYNKNPHTYSVGTALQDSITNRFYSKICANIGDWKTSEVTSQCKCFYSTRYKIHCCCSKSPITLFLNRLTLNLAMEKEWHIKGFGYREQILNYLDGLVDI